MQTIELTKYQSINQIQGREGLSDVYSYIPTTRVIDTLSKQGWTPVNAQEVKARNNPGFQKHLIRFRQENTSYNNEEIPEIVLTNSHDGKASFQLMAGIFRCVCSNGLIVADSMFAAHKILHKGYTDELVINAAYDIVTHTPRVINRISNFKAITLSKDEQVAFIESALPIKYNEERLKDLQGIINIDRLLRPRRKEDADRSLWNTYNMIQENFIKGGMYLNTLRSYRPGKARGVNNITENVRINKSLWMLTEKMAEIKGSAIA